MSEFELESGLFVTPSPGGAYYAAFSPEQDVSRRVLFGLMRNATSVQLDVPALCELSQLEERDALDLSVPNTHAAFGR